MTVLDVDDQRVAKVNNAAQATIAGTQIEALWQLRILAKPIGMPAS